MKLIASHTIDVAALDFIVLLERKNGIRSLFLPRSQQVLNFTVKTLTQHFSHFWVAKDQKSRNYNTQKYQIRWQEIVNSFQSVKI